MSLAHGNWTAWSEWSACNETCGMGKRWKERTCSDPPPGPGGNDCPGNGTEMEACEGFECPGVKRKKLGKQGQ